MSTDYYAPRFEVRIAGTTMAAQVANQVTSLTYDNNVDETDKFEFSLNNPNHRFTDDPLFDLGKEVEVHMGYGGDLKPMIKGEIISVQPSFPESGASTIRISGYDKSHRLRHNQPDRPPYKLMNASVIAAQIAAENGLTPVVDPAPFVPEEIPQHTSDMELLKALARENFFDCYVHWDSLYFRLPRPQTDAVVLEWGKSLSSFTPRLSGAAKTGMQVVRGYNERFAETVIGSATAAELDLDDLVEKAGSQVVDLLGTMGRKAARNLPVKSPLEAATIAKSLLQETLEGMYEGSGSCIGMPELKAGEFVTIHGLGKRFSGRYRLRQVTHTIDDGGYRTSFEVTQRNGASLLGFLRKAVANKPSANPVYGVAVGKVINNVDPEGLGRVKLMFPWFSDECASPWARCAAPMAGDNRGFYLLPEIDDEVVCSFEHGDLRAPLVIGALWNGQARPPQNNEDGTNSIRQIKTRSGHTITFDDTQERTKLSIASAGGHEIAMDDTTDHPKLTIATSAGHKIRLDDQPDQEKLILEAKGGSKITIDGDSRGINVQSNGTVTISATQIKIGKKASQNAMLGNSFLTLYANHTHPTAMGPSGPPVPLATETAVLSDTVIISK